MERVVIGMSGGVDSSVAAAVLKEQGYEVVGVTMKLWESGENGACAGMDAGCVRSAEEDAAQAAQKLGIEHHILDFREEFSRQVVDYFTQAYLRGRTPNPCIACNRFLKFGALQRKAGELGAEKIATGHYARVEWDEKTGRYLLRRAASSAKDQTYALYALTQEQLSRTLMPLGDFPDKAAVRRKAEKLGLSAAGRPDSMEICFVPDQDYAAFIERRTGFLPPPGDFVDSEGKVLGKHRGIVHYTVGQRKGLGIAFGKPMFVLKIDPERNRVVLGEKGTEFSQELLAEDWNFIPFDLPESPMRVEAKIRYSARPAPAEIWLENRGLRVRFEQPQRAVTPGQAVVFYAPDSDLVLGGATIVE